MSYSEVGKAAKRAGITHAKHTPIPPDAPTPAPNEAKQPPKKFGLRYESKWFRGSFKWHYRWFKKEAHRDQAFHHEEISLRTWQDTGMCCYRNLEKVER